MNDKRKIIALGLRPNQSQNVFSGQSMMFEAFVENVIENGYNTTVIDLGSKYTNINVGKIEIKRIFEYLGIIIKVFASIVKNKGGIVYITTAQTKGGFLRDFLFINFSKLYKCKLLLQQFGSNFGDFYASLSSIEQKVVLYTFNKCDYLIVEGELTKKQFDILNDYDRKVLVVKNGLPEKNITDRVLGKTYSNGTFNLIYLSYMIESKGYWDVLYAINILDKKYKIKVNCVFSGAFKASVDDEKFKNINEAKESFKRYIVENDLSDSIVYVEGLMGEKKDKAFLNSHVFLLPSYFKFEGQPVSVLEAMAHGVVPIVTRYRLIPEMVTDDTGIFVNAKSPDEIANGIKTLIENPRLYSKFSQANVDRYKQNFTLENYCKMLLSIVSELN